MKKSYILILISFLVSCATRSEKESYIKVHYVDSLPVFDSTFEGQVFDEYGNIIFDGLNYNFIETAENGINGLIINRSEIDGQGITTNSFLYNDKYANEDFFASIKNDTIETGSVFEMGLSVFIDKFDFFVLVDDNKIHIENKLFKHEGDNTFYNYKIKCNEKGKHTFEEIIVIEDEEYEITYNYIVI